MRGEQSKELVHVGAGRAVRSRALAPALGAGSRALALAARSPAVRRAAMAGIAFAVGYRLSAMLRSGGLPQAASAARDVYRATVEDNREAQGRLVGGWVRGSVTVFSTVYRFLDKEAPE